MFDVLKKYLSDRAQLSEEQLQLICSFFVPKHLEKGEFILSEGEIAKYGSFVVSGCLRSYVIDNKGKEHIIQFAPETWWITDITSILNQTPSLYFMDALEPSDILMIDFAAHQKIAELVPAFNRAFQAGQQKHTSAKDKRIIASLTTTAEERYQHFLETYLTIAQRVPQHMLASYLGITPETLSRIRKRWAEKK